MRTIGANELIGKGALEDTLENGLAFHLLQMLVDLIGERDEEVEGVLLLAQVDLLAPHAKRLPERLGHIVLELALF